MMAKIWLLSDTHFGHQNMYKFVSFDGVTRVRPQFDDAKDADEYMIEMWNNMIDPSDHAYHLGDVAIPKHALQLVKKLNGHKRLVLGNHDTHPSQLYLDIGFEKLRGLHQMAGLWLSHAPIHWGEEHAAERIGKFIGNVHGHTHEVKSPTPWHFNVCVEHTNYAPVELDWVVEIMKTRKENGYQKP